MIYTNVSTNMYYIINEKHFNVFEKTHNKRKYVSFQYTTRSPTLHHYEISRPNLVNMSLHRYTVIPRIWIIAETPRRPSTITPYTSLSVKNLVKNA